MTQAEAFVAAARSFVGTPFHAGGRLPGVGLDCIGVAVCAARACGIGHRDVPAYPLRPNGQLLGELDRQLVRVGQPEPGDVLAMTFEMRGTPHHVAVYAGATLIHAYLLAAKCVEQPMTDYWRERVVRVYRFRELA